MDIAGFKYESVYVLDSRAWFEEVRDEYDVDTDLVLTYDFALKKEIEEVGGRAAYLDHLIPPEIMQENNFRIYDFFRTWHLGKDGRDLFIYKDIPFGFALRLYFWSDYVFYIRTYLSISYLQSIDYERLAVGTRNGVVERILLDRNIPFYSLDEPSQVSDPAYYFPIQDWMSSKLVRRGLKARLRTFATCLIGIIFKVIDSASASFDNKKPLVFVHLYHPTRAILKALRRDRRLRTVSTWTPREALVSRLIPICGNPKAYRECANIILSSANQSYASKLVLANGEDISDKAYALIESAITERLPDLLLELDCIIKYLDRFRIDLLVLIANIGETATLLDVAAKARGIPSYLIINGILGPAYLDESKYASLINSYSHHIKATYFRGLQNVVCLGDPRMDTYQSAKSRPPKGPFFRVTIGASGYNSIDLNSYVAVEFEFLSDVLSGLRVLRLEGMSLSVTLKVRANGYIRQYIDFCHEYFPNEVDCFEQSKAIVEVLQQTDCYISIYSQTLFEASCLGVTSIYYRKDDEILDPPFDGQCELVTADSPAQLAGFVRDAECGHPRFSPFLDRKTMEKYIGPLDGKNTLRNINQIYNFIGLSEMG